MRHQDRRLLDARPTPSLSLVESLLEDEAQSLEQRYGAGKFPHSRMLLGGTDSTVGLDDDRHKIQDKCQEFNVISFEIASFQAEQERELSPETEREQQVQLPPASDPHCHTVHQDVQQLVTQGIFTRFSTAFQPAFQSLHNTTAQRF